MLSEDFSDGCYDAAAAALVEAVTKSAASMPQATNFAMGLDAMRRDVGSAAALICSELCSAAMRTRSGEARIAFHAPEPPPPAIGGPGKAESAPPVS